MKYVDEFRDPKKADRLLREIRALVEQIPGLPHPAIADHGSLRRPYACDL